MKNYFESGNALLTNQLATRWFSDIAEAFNKIYKRQMETSIEMGNQLLNNPLVKEKPAVSEDFLGMNIFKSNTELFAKNVEMLTDLSKKMLGFTYDSLYNEKNTNAFSNKISESVIDIFEKQTKQIKDFNNYVLETLEKNSNMDSSLLIKNFKKNIEDNMDASLENIKTLLKPENKNTEYLVGANKKVMDEMIRQMDLISKSGISFWNDLMTSMGQVSKVAQEEKLPGTQLEKQPDTQKEKQPEKELETKMSLAKEIKKEELVKVTSKR